VGTEGVIDAWLDPRDTEEHLLLIQRFIEDLIDNGNLPEDTTIQVNAVPEEDWMSVFRSQHGIVPISDRLVIRPSWCDPVGPDDLILDPGMAFGTGSHATTRMCLELLDTLVNLQHTGRMLDLGTGSGILAIAGARLGLVEILAVDADPMAVKVAVRNTLSNLVDDRVKVAKGGVEAAEGRYDIITANLSSSVLKRFSYDIAQLLRPGGSLIISGILEDEKANVMEAFTRCGLSVEKVTTEETWVAALLRHKV
jgi:ribosomal protein L11 methyltransferase